MRDVNVNGGTANITVNEFPSQQSLRLESVDQKPIPVKMTLSEKQYWIEQARIRGVGTSKYIRDCLREYADLKPRLLELQEILNDSFTKR